jgi:hypothetical protein
VRDIRRLNENEIFEMYVVHGAPRLLENGDGGSLGTQRVVCMSTCVYPCMKSDANTLHADDCTSAGTDWRVWSATASTNGKYEKCSASPTCTVPLSHPVPYQTARRC